jgi:glutamyl-tRNA reductase
MLRPSRPILHPGFIGSSCRAPILAAVIVGSVMLVVGVSHETAGLAARERVALDDLGARSVLRGLRDDPAVSEVVVLSTCNRTEIYAVAESAHGGEAAIRRALLEHTAVGAATLACSGYALFELAAAEHLFRVAAGLESAILGETEICGQVRAAAQRARDERTLGPLLSGLFQRSLIAARRVRQRTRISVGALSLASVVADLVAAMRGDGPHRRVVLLGAGRLAQSLAGALAAAPATELVIVNRTPAAARALAERHGATAAGLERLEPELRRADAVVCAAEAPHPLVSADAIRRAVGPPQRPVLLVDLAVPRNVEPRAAAVAGVVLHDIDAVQRMVGRNLAARRRAARAAASMTRGEVERFAAWRGQRHAAPVVAAVRRQAEQLRREELARVAGTLSAEEHARLDRLTASLLSKLLHGPCARLRAASAKPDGAAHVETFRMLFDVAAEGGGDSEADVIALPRRGAA